MVPLWKDADSGVRVVRLNGNGNEARDARSINRLLALFREVVAEEGWQPGDALERAQDAESVFFALETCDGQFVGGLQLTIQDERGMLPYVVVWPEARDPIQAASGSRAAHIGILALTPEIRGQGLLFWRLAVEMWRYCVGGRISTLFIEVTPRVLPIYQRLGWPLKIRGELRPHWGEPCYLCTLGIPEVAETILRRAEHSRLYRQIIEQAFRVAYVDSEANLPMSRSVREKHAVYDFASSYAVSA